MSIVRKSSIKNETHNIFLGCYLTNEYLEKIETSFGFSTMLSLDESFVIVMRGVMSSTQLCGRCQQALLECH